MRGQRGSISVVVAAIAFVSARLHDGHRRCRVGSLPARAHARGRADAAALAAAQELALPSGARRPSRRPAWPNATARS